MALSMVVSTVWLKAGPWAEKKDSKCGKSSGFVKVLRWLGEPYMKNNQDETSSSPHLFSKASLARREFSRSIQHICNFLELISQFPITNPSAADAASDVDISKLLRQIRSKYKILCSNLGVRPRLTVSRQTPSHDHEEGPDDIPEQKSQLPVWKIEKGNPSKPVTGQDLTFWCSTCIFTPGLFLCNGKSTRPVSDHVYALNAISDVNFSVSNNV